MSTQDKLKAVEDWLYETGKRSDFDFKAEAGQFSYHLGKDQKYSSIWAGIGFAHLTCYMKTHEFQLESGHYSDQLNLDKCVDELYNAMVSLEPAVEKVFADKRAALQETIYNLNRKLEALTHD